MLSYPAHSLMLIMLSNIGWIYNIKNTKICCFITLFILCWDKVSLCSEATLELLLKLWDYNICHIRLTIFSPPIEMWSNGSQVGFQLTLQMKMTLNYFPSHVMGLQMHATMPSWEVSFLNIVYFQIQRDIAHLRGKNLLPIGGKKCTYLRGI